MQYLCIDIQYLSLQLIAKVQINFIFNKSKGAEEINILVRRRRLEMNNYLLLLQNKKILLKKILHCALMIIFLILLFAVVAVVGSSRNFEKKNGILDKISL